MKTAFITGGAEGIGFEIVKLLISKGFRVGICDINESKMEAAKNTFGDKIEVYKADVRKSEELKTAIDTYAEHVGGVFDLLVNNAGLGLAGAFEDKSVEEYERVVDVNVLGVIRTTYHALPYIKNAKGQIINISSASAVYGNPEIPVYAATKSAIRSLTEGWSIGFKKYGVKVSDVMPFYVQTKLLEEAAPGHGSDVQKVALQPQDVAEMVWKSYNSYQVHRIKGVVTWWQNQFKEFIPHAIMTKMVLDFTKYK